MKNLGIKYINVENLKEYRDIREAIADGAKAVQYTAVDPGSYYIDYCEQSIVVTFDNAHEMLEHLFQTSYGNDFEIILCADGKRYKAVMQTPCTHKTAPDWNVNAWATGADYEWLSLWVQSELVALPKGSLYAVGTRCRGNFYNERFYYGWDYSYDEGGEEASCPFGSKKDFVWEWEYKMEFEQGKQTLIIRRACDTYETGSEAADEEMKRLLEMHGKKGYKPDMLYQMQRILGGHNIATWIEVDGEANKRLQRQIERKRQMERNRYECEVLRERLCKLEKEIEGKQKLS